MARPTIGGFDTQKSLFSGMFLGFLRNCPNGARLAA